MVTAKALPGFLKLNNLQLIEGEFVAETDCHDYDAWCQLPIAIEIPGTANKIILGKTGWSSDTGIACYKEKVLLGQIVDLKA